MGGGADGSSLPSRPGDDDDILSTGTGIFGGGAAGSSSASALLSSAPLAPSQLVAPSLSAAHCRLVNLKLQTSLRVDNMHAFDATGAIQKYRFVEEIIEAQVGH